MSRPDDPGFLLWLLLVIPVADLAATTFFARLFWISKRVSPPEPAAAYQTRRFNHPLVRWVGRPLRFVFEGRSWLLALLAASFAIITAVFCWIGFLVARRFLDLPAMQGTAVATTLLIVLLGTIPIVFWIAFWITRRSSGRPPTFGEEE